MTEVLSEYIGHNRQVNNKHNFQFQVSYVWYKNWKVWRHIIFTPTPVTHCYTSLDPIGATPLESPAACLSFERCRSHTFGFLIFLAICLSKLSLHVFVLIAILSCFLLPFRSFVRSPYMDTRANNSMTCARDMNSTPRLTRAILQYLCCLSRQQQQAYP